MSETLFHSNVPAPRAPLEIVPDQAATQAEHTAQVIDLPVQSQEEYIGRHRAETANPDRFATRVAGRISELAGGFADNMANRRTASQALSELDDKTIAFGQEKLARGKEIATKIGGPIVSEIKFDFGNAVTGFKEIGIGLKDMGKEGAESVRNFWKTRAEAARERRAARIDARQQKREAKAFEKTWDQAHKMNDRFDRSKERAANRAIRAERRQELSEQAKAAAKQAGKGALLAVGIVPAAVAYGTYKGAEAGGRAIKNGAVRANEYAGKKIEQAVDYGTRAVDAYAEVQKYKQADKAEKAATEKAAHNASISIARREAEAEIRAKADAKVAKVTAKFEKKVK